MPGVSFLWVPTPGTSRRGSKYPYQDLGHRRGDPCFEHSENLQVSRQKRRFRRTPFSVFDKTCIRRRFQSRRRRWAVLLDRGIGSRAGGLYAVRSFLFPRWQDSAAVALHFDWHCLAETTQAAGIIVRAPVTMHHRSLRINRRLLPSGLTVPAPRTRAEALTLAVAEALTDAVLGAPKGP